MQSHELAQSDNGRLGQSADGQIARWNHEFVRRQLRGNLGRDRRHQHIITIGIEGISRDDQRWPLLGAAQVGERKGNKNKRRPA
ncbi:MAG: hypothetical protein O2960_10375 [Verrucomicrobia bacterium]|nr:hypothetical protein [Verrucomicrobiota bacterium]